RLRSGAGRSLRRERSVSRRLGTLLGSLGRTVAGLSLLRELTVRLTLRLPLLRELVLRRTLRLSVAGLSLLRELTLLLAVAGLSLTLRLAIALHLRSVGLRVLGGLTRVRRQRRPGDVETEGRGGLSASAGLTEARGLVDVDALDAGAVVAVVGGEGVQMQNHLQSGVQVGGLTLVDQSELLVGVGDRVTGLIGHGLVHTREVLAAGGDVEAQRAGALVGLGDVALLLEEPLELGHGRTVGRLGRD